MTRRQGGKLNKPSSANPCKARNRQGQPCGAFALAEGDYCWTHDPANAERRKQARRQGGKARHRNISWSDDEHRPAIHILTVADVKALLERAILHELTRENSHARNRTIGYLAMVALKALEVGEMEQRISELEARANARN